MCTSVKYIYICIYTHVYMSVHIYKTLYLYQGLLYHRTCKPDILCSWPSLNSYLNKGNFFNTVPVSWIQHSLKNFPLI